MAAAKSKKNTPAKRTGAGTKKSAAKRSTVPRSRAKSRQPESVFSSAMAGLLLLAVAVFLFICMITTSNALIVVEVRKFITALFGVLRHVAILLLALFGLQIAFGDRWPVPRSSLLFAALLFLCLETLLQVFSYDTIMISLRNEGYQQNYNGFLWKSYEASKNTPLGGGFVGALLGYPMGNLLDVLGSVLILFFAIGGLLLVLIHQVFPGAGERIGIWYDQLREDLALRREDRDAERAAREADAALLVPVPEELREPDEETPPVKKTVARGRKVAKEKPTPAAAPAPNPKPASPAPPPVAKPARQPLSADAQGNDHKPTLYIEDILPQQHTPSEDAYTEQDVERYKQRYRPSRKNPDALPDFIAKRRAQYDAAYGAFTAPEANPAPTPFEESAYDPPHIPEFPALDLPEAPEPEPLEDDAPWETIDPYYAPEANAPAPSPRRRRKRMENPLDRQPQLDPEARLDRPDWKPEEPPQVVDTVPEVEEYRQPPFYLLVRDDRRQQFDSREQDAVGAQKLEDTLLSFGVEARVIKVVHGPAITRYELQPAPGVKVSKIVSLTDDIALNMAAVGVRIEAPIPGKAAIGIEIANDEIATVHLRDVLESDESLRHPSRLAVALGKDIAGKRIIADLARMPHLLIAGATGSGKSVCINTIITSIIYRATPEEVRMILIDPKKVELSVYNGIPHLLVPVVTDAKKASGALSWAVMEMDERYKLFAEAGVRDIRGYNAQRKGDTPLMPQILVVIDELSDLMLVAPGEVEESICRLAQLARACGIHLVIATQRPSVNVITGIIKANIPSRIAFAVSSQVDSRTILDTAGAEKLLGKGDMLYAPSGGGKPTRVQGCFVTDEEVFRVSEYVKDRHTTDYSQAVINALSESENAEDENGEDAGDQALDELFDQAVEMAIESGQASISMLQRRLRIGYARAGRLIDEMTRRNIISAAEGAKPREVLITREDFNLLFKK